MRFELTAAVRLISWLWDMKLRRKVIESRRDAGNVASCLKKSVSKTFASDYRLVQPHILLWYAQDVEIFYFHMFLPLTDSNHMIGPLRR